jgi:transcription elongation factor Elf1
MATEPLPLVVAVPCTKCGEEAVVQVIVKYTVANGVQMEAKVSQQCGCEARSGTI